MTTIFSLGLDQWRGRCIIAQSTDSIALSVFAALIFHQGAVRPWICSTGVLRPFCVRGKGGGCHADTLPAGERGRGTFARGPVVGRTHPESGSHRPSAPHPRGAARASLPGGRLRPRCP